MGGRTAFFDALAWGFVGFTTLLVMGVLWLWWEESRDVARRGKSPQPRLKD